MATILRTPSSLLLPPSAQSRPSAPPPRACLAINQRRLSPRPRLKLTRSPGGASIRLPSLKRFAVDGETAETEAEEEAVSQEELVDEVDAENGANDGGVVETDEKVASILIASLQSYKEALANDDQTTVADIETFLQSIENEKNSLVKKVATLSEELSAERDRVLRISADFDNFRKRTERERLSLMSNVQGEVVESLLPVIDNFERAKTQIKVETEGEEKINNSYQSIAKQFWEILSSLGVEAVETVGCPFDPLLHEAIMQEESLEFEEGIILQEFRKGFKLGERLLRPAMVKVSAGPGPAKPKAEDTPAPAEEDHGESSKESIKAVMAPDFPKILQSKSCKGVLIVAATVFLLGAFGNVWWNEV